jgi:hypothetical protein
MGALVAVGLAIAAAGSDLGKRRAMAAWAVISSPPADGLRAAEAVIGSRVNETERETRRLSDAMRALTSAREQLAGRLTLLERRLEDLTGSMSLTQPLRHPPAAALAALSAGPGTEAGPKVEPPGSPVPATAETPPAAKPTTTNDSREAAPAEPAAAPAPAPTLAAEPPVGAVPPVPAADVPLPRPSPLAVAQAAGPPSGTRNVGGPATAAGEVATGAVAPRPRLGVDLGAAATVDGLRGLWTRIRESQTPLLDDLRPLIAVKETARPGGGVELRLLAGPVPNAGAAARLCGALTASGIACRATAFDGQKLAVQ